MSAPLHQVPEPPETADLDQVIGLSRSMLEQARQGEWEAVVDIEQRRNRVLYAFFDQPVNPEVAQQVADGIREIMELDRQVVDLSKQRMQELSDSLQQIQRGRSGCSSYLAHTG